ncbi:methyltransferase [Defluviimonas sp. 20V17]|uniref:Methyltransferase n=1 Tax=Allgaiera indica TaxID=765699 RepID=A0AAN4UNQ2_9RHOB|nr:methyltransferase [Allgaiera indica]KDB01789.1 methyltransferase [Defluviimonas sp. 20V17]GHD98869.1 methyltransferase [Allgaiera indica]SDW04421.1 tRNA1(Val) A37 N6-methylase TrmN6 [Allgaiera indica]
MSTSGAERAFAADELTEDGFLGGRLRIAQPRNGYRAATDPVLMAAACPARPGQAVLELGCGAGVASICLGARVAGVEQTGMELQHAYADLARRNARANGIALRVIEGDVARPPADLRALGFDHVMINPPWYPAGGGTEARDPGRETGLREATPLAAWIDLAVRRLRPGGWLTLIHLAARLPDLLAGCDGRLGSMDLLPLAPRGGRPATRILLRARKGGRGGFRLLSPFVLHEGAAHLRDENSHSAAAEAILRHGEALNWPAR